VEEINAQNAFAFKGILSGAAEPQINELSSFVAAHNVATIKMDQVSRIDFVCAGTLLNILGNFKKQGKSIQIIGANQILHALLQVLGFDKVVQLTQQKPR
jgi:ABC-type transporter Mla MlaB component